MGRGLTLVSHTPGPFRDLVTASGWDGDCRRGIKTRRFANVKACWFLLAFAPSTFKGKQPRDFLKPRLPTGGCGWVAWRRLLLHPLQVRGQRGGRANPLENPAPAHLHILLVPICFWALLPG